ncbi:hypothetical protein BsWGS_10523 [Bradybaena similaris]
MNLLLLSVTSSLLCIVVIFALKYLSLLRWISGHAYVLSKQREHFSILEMLDLFKNVKALLHVLKNISQSCEWKPGVISASNTHSLASLEVPVMVRGIPSMPVQVDCVKEERLCYSQSRFGLQSHDPWFTENVVPTVSLEYKRFWHREDNGVCWLIQMNETLQTCEFYLIQPIQEVDRCLVSVVTWSRRHSASCVDNASILLSSLIEYISLRKLQKTPLSTITLPQDLSDSDAESSESGGGQESVGQEATLLSKSRSLALDKHASSNITGKNIPLEKRKIELEKYSSILKYRCKNGTPSTSSSTGDIGAAAAASSDFQPKSNGFTPLYSAKNQDVERTKSALRRSVSDNSALRQSSIASLKTEAQSVESDDSVDGSIPEQRVPSSFDSREDVSDEDLEIARYKTMSNHSASELLAETLKASNINLELPPDKQAESSGGWIFSSFDKNIVVLRKLQRPGVTVQSYIGKGFVLAPPKAVWDAVRNPRTRFTYDDTLKKVDIISTIDNTLKIVYFYHESQQFLMKENCDMCVLHGERQDGQRYILTYSSIEHDKCPVNQNITRAKVLPSGWIIEPAKQDKKTFSIVTYLMQIDFGSHPDGSDNMPFQDMISRYPLSIADLQQYLKPAVQMLQQKSFT